MSPRFAPLVRMPELNTPRRKFRPYRIYSEYEAKKMRRKRQLIVFFVASLILAVAAGYGYYYYNSFFEKTEDARLATHSSALATKVNGKVAKIFVNETQAVNQGDPILQIDQKEFQTVLDQRQRELDRLEDRLKGGRVYLGKMQQGLAGGGDAARSKYDGARAWYGRLYSKAQELRQSVAEAKDQLKATTILAPADGHVAKKLVDVGVTVTAGQPLVEFVGVGQPWVVANFKEIQLEKMSSGQRAEIFVPSLGKTFMGKVENLPAKTAISSRSEFEHFVRRFLSSGASVPVRIAFDPNSIANSVNRMANGAPAEVKVFIK